MNHAPVPLLRSGWFLLVCALATASLSRAEVAPPTQDHVTAIGRSPLKAPATADFTTGANLTMEGWIYLSETSPFAWIMGKGLATSGVDPFVSFALQLNNDGTKLTFACSTGAAGSYRQLDSPSALPLRTWTHVAAVLEGGTTMRLFINGVQVATNAAAGAPLAAATIPFGVGIAFRGDGSTNYSSFSGYARHVRLWSVARSAAQITAAVGQSLPTDRVGLIAAWPLDEASGSTARDVSGAGRALTAASGQLASIRLGVLAAGPFFTTTSTAITDGSLRDVTDGEVIDFDGDGDLDLVAFQISWPPTLPETRTRLRAFRNNNGTFVDATDAVLGNVTMVHPRHSAVADFNGDGRSDLIVIGHGTDMRPYPGEQSKLLIRSADGRLVDETATRLPQRTSFTHHVAAIDIDADGDLDLYMGNVNGGDVGPRFYLNNGTGVFTEAADRLPADIANRSAGRNYTAVLSLDVNRDGRSDLVLGSGGEQALTNEILLNDGSGRFVRDAAYTLPPKLLGPKSSVVAIAPGDFNGDGAVDLLFATTGGSITMPDGAVIDGYSIPGIQVLLNRGDGTFYESGASSRFSWSSDEKWVIWTRVADLDGDNRPDIVASVATDSGAVNRVRIFLNRGAAEFVEVTDALPAAAGGNSFVHPGDFDRDGRIDLLSGNGVRISVARGLKPIDRAAFQSAADDPGRLTNLSVRTQAGIGDQTLIAGFALSGSGTKPLMVRAIGPALNAFGLTGTLADPLVEIAPLGGTKLAENNDWGGTAALKNAFASVGAFSLSPDSGKDAALVFSPGTGAYTARVTGSGNGTGIALVEVYDTGTGSALKLVNLSARSQTGIGSDVLIAGFVINGNVPKKLLIRAIGPTLGVFGVGGTLADPVLAIRPLGSDSVIATNDNWNGTAALKTAFARVGAFNLAVDTSRDAAIAVELPPGAYTATAFGSNNTTGVVLIEVYELP